MLKYRRRHKTQLQKSQTQIMQNKNGYEAFHDSNENIETKKWRAFVNEYLQTKKKKLSAIFSGGMVAGIPVAICIFFESRGITAAVVARVVVVHYGPSMRRGRIICA